MPQGWSDERLAAAIYKRHHAHPDDAALWHIGADTPEGGLLGDAFRKSDASHIAAFLAGAGDFGLWWPETWRNVSAHLRARPALAGLSVVLLLGTVDRAPHYWKDAKDDRGKTLRDELDRLRGLRYEGSLTVVGEGDHCFTDGPELRCITVRQLIEELEAAPAQIGHMIDTSFGVDVYGPRRARVDVVPVDWDCYDLGQGKHLLFPKRAVAVAEPCLLARMPGVGPPDITPEVR
jgi:hypothetical protein